MYQIRLLELREHNKLTQEKIAKICNISQETYSLWETNSEIIPLKHLNTLCNYYQVNIDYMLKLTNTKKYSNSINIETLNRNDVGKRIKIFRAEYQLTLRSLASCLNTTSSTISAYETGKTLILTAFAYQIATNYNVSIDWLLGKTKEMKIK